MKILCSGLLKFAFSFLLTIPSVVPAQDAKKKREHAVADEPTGQHYSFLGEFSKSAHISIPHEKAGSGVVSFSENSSPATAFEEVKFFGPVNCGGRTRAILPDKTNPDLIFAGTNTGGLWKSTDGGSNWSPINDHTPGMNITCIDQNPFNPDEIYYGTGEHKVRKIQNKGNGIYKSSDHGLTFSVLPVTANDSFLLINSLKHSLVSDSTIYVATSFHGLYRTEDGGVSFQVVFKNGKRITDIECFPDGKIMFTAAFDGIYFSASGDSGTFSKITAGLPQFGFSRIEMAYCDSFPLVMYALFGDSLQDPTTDLDGAFKSVDGGMSWNEIANPDSVVNFFYADYILAIAVRPDNPNVFIAGGERACMSFNGGQSFIYLPFPRFDQHAYVFNKFDTDIFYAGNDQGLYRFDITQWPFVKNDLMYNYNTAQLWAGSYFPTGNHFFIGIQDNVFQVNAVDDSMFVRINGYGTDGKNTHVHQQNPVIGYACGDFAEVFRIDDMTDSLPVFTVILNEMDANSDGIHDDDVWHENVLEMNYLDGDQLYMPTRDFLWRSTNGGNNWSKVTNSFAGSATAPHPYAIGLSNDVYPTAYLGGTAGFFYRIDDVYNATPGQETDLSASVPQQLIPGGKITCLTVHPQNNDIVYATVLDADSISHIWKITDALSATPVWTDISGNFNNSISTYWIEPDPDNADSILFVGTDYGLWFTTDAGNTWSRETQVPMITVFQMRLRKSDRKLFVYTFGRGIWIGTLPASGTGIQEYGATDLEVYPNPARDFCHIRTNSKSGIKQYSLSDQHGKVLKVESVNELRTHPVSIDLRNLPSGVYILEVHTHDSLSRSKLVKL